MTSPDQDYSQYDKKRVIVTLKDSPDKLEGTVDTGNDLGLLIKPKGKAALDLISADRIDGVEVVPEPEKKIAVKTLLPLKEGQARQHLVDRHGYAVADIEKMSEEDALKFHNTQIDHAPLGHKHEEKKEEQPATDGGEAAAAEADAENPSEQTEPTSES